MHITILCTHVHETHLYESMFPGTDKTGGHVSAFSYMVRQANNSGLLAISYMVRQAKSKKLPCLGTQDKQTVT